ncbi:MAG TPA: hypothetical protein VGB43_08455 [Flavobacterium sp.]|jgi:hypothetical protein
MKTKLFIFAFFASLFSNLTIAQDRTTVTATSNDISDNLDLRAVASVFGDSDNLNDFERRLNDPKLKISNLDLNGDNQVDYLRVIESVENNTHLIIIQSVLGRDNFQDVATVEVEKDRHNNVQVQVVGDAYMYGNNYIYEPVYYQQPPIYNTFWVNNYRPYYSSWYYGYYPAYYYAWSPYPVYNYWANVNTCINVHHHYNYVNIRRSHRAVVLHNARRSNGYEVQYPNRSFTHRNNNVANTQELNNIRNTGNIRNNNTGTPRSGLTAQTPVINTPKGGIRNNTPHVAANSIPAINTTPRNETASNSVNVPVISPKGSNEVQNSQQVYNATTTPRGSVRTPVKQELSSGNTFTPRGGTRGYSKSESTFESHTIRQTPQRSATQPSVRENSNRNSGGGNTNSFSSNSGQRSTRR